MSLQVVTKASTATADRSKAQIVIESTLGSSGGSFQAAFDELNDPQTRAVAQQYAASIGMGTPRINGNVIGPYAVNSDGIPLDEIKRTDENGAALPATLPQFQPAHYRVTVPLCQPIM